jgi:tRNA threonylcarbamoyladenosine biosynthesis protein TsaB
MKLLAIDCSTEQLSLAVADGEQRWEHAGEGGAHASASLLPAIMGLLDKAQLSLKALDAIAFGRGPGRLPASRTACAVAQGLALGANLPLVPVDTLLMLAVAASSHSPRVLSVLDARMGQVYVPLMRTRRKRGPACKHPCWVRLRLATSRHMACARLCIGQQRPCALWAGLRGRIQSRRFRRACMANRLGVVELGCGSLCTR